MRLALKMERRTSPRKQPAVMGEEESITHEEEGQDYGKDVGQRGLGL